jgi:uncharacterized membrane protein YbaN (DUF454 family)
MKTFREPCADNKTGGGECRCTLSSMSAPLRYVLLICGWLALGLGMIGIVLPVLPTTPFVLLAAACFLRSSKKLHTWLVSSPRFGPHINNYLAGRGLRQRTKVVALVMLWASVLSSAHFFVSLLAVDLAMVAVAAAVSVYILRLPTYAGAGPHRSDATG